MADQPGELLSPTPLPPGSRVACRVEYDGSAYCGWQSQPHLEVPTVQETLERALSGVAAAPLRVHCAGRTDTGVHGHGQIIHFDAPVARSPKAWVMGGNANLPPTVRLHWAVPVPEAFHARFSALSRRYRYIISNTQVRPALLEGKVTPYRRALDAGLMEGAAQALLGERDFSAFRAAACQSSTPMRNVQEVTVRRFGAQWVIIDIEANAFLHHMVRNIVGSLLMVGAGLRPDQWIGELLEGRDRTLAGDTAASDGLYLTRVTYPETYSLPMPAPGPLMLPD